MAASKEPVLDLILLKLKLMVYLSLHIWGILIQIWQLVDWWIVCLSVMFSSTIFISIAWQNEVGPSSTIKWMSSLVSGVDKGVYGSRHIRVHVQRMKCAVACYFLYFFSFRNFFWLKMKKQNTLPPMRSTWWNFFIYALFIFSQEMLKIGKKGFFHSF